MSYKRQSAPADLDAEGIRKYIEEQLLRIQRSSGESDTTLESLQNQITAINSQLTSIDGRVTVLEGFGDFIVSTFSINFTSSGNTQNATSIVIPPGTYELTAQIAFAGPGATTSTDYQSIISSNSAASIVDANSISGYAQRTRRPSAGDVSQLHVHPPYQVTNPGPGNATYYLHLMSIFAVSSYGATGYLRASKVLP